MTVSTVAHRGLIKKLIQLVFFFALAAVVSYAFSMGVEKQSIQSLQDYNSVRTFAIIAGRNSIIFLVLLSSVFVERHLGTIISGLFALVNGGAVGALVARFPTAEYSVLLLPHGILEMSAYFLLLGTVSVYQPVKNAMPQQLLILVGVAYALLLGAAWIEAFVTPYLAVNYLT